jgi:hypothetical protein
MGCDDTRTLAEIDAELAALRAKKAQLAGMPDSVTIGPNRFAGVTSAYERLKEEIEDLCAERDALVNHGGCPVPTRGNV